MIKMFLTLTFMLISMMMLYIDHPLSMGIFLLIQTLILCLLSSVMTYSYWFSYILFLTFLGGLLILFVYVSSIASNEIFKISMKFYIYYMIFSFIILMITFLLKNNLYWMNININYETNNLFNTILFLNNENLINLSKLYNNQTYFLMMMMIIYLFITLIAIVKITNIFFGPLRSFQ